MNASTCAAHAGNNLGGLSSTLGGGAGAGPAAAAGATGVGGAECSSHWRRASIQQWVRMAWTTGATSSAALCRVPATSTPLRNGWTTTFTKSSAVVATSASVDVRSMARAFR